MKGMAERFNVKDCLRTRIILKINASKECNRSVIEKYRIIGQGKYLSSLEACVP